MPVAANGKGGRFAGTLRTPCSGVFRAPHCTDAHDAVPRVALSSLASLNSAAHYSANFRSSRPGPASGLADTPFPCLRGPAQGEGLRLVCEKVGESQNYVLRQPAVTPPHEQAIRLTFEKVQNQLQLATISATLVERPPVSP